jgi:hypothetical protein
MAKEPINSHGMVWLTNLSYWRGSCYSSALKLDAALFSNFSFIYEQFLLGPFSLIAFQPLLLRRTEISAHRGPASAYSTF